MRQLTRHTACCRALSLMSAHLQKVCMCPHTTTYVSSYYYVCVLVLLYICVLVLLVSSHYYMCPHTTIYVSSFYYICVLILLYMSSCYSMCPHTTVSSYYMRPHTGEQVSRDPSRKCMCPRTTTMCPHTTIQVSTCVLILL